MSQTSNDQFITQLESILGAREKQYAREMVTKLGIENVDDLSLVDDKLLKDDMGLKGIPRKRIMRCLEAYLTKKRPRDSDQEEDSRPRKSNRTSNVEESKVENDGSSRDALSDSQGDDDDGNVDDDDDDDDESLTSSTKPPSEPSTHLYC